MAKKSKPKFKRAVSHEDAKDIIENSSGVVKPADDVAVLNHPENFEQPWDETTKLSIADTPISVLNAAYKKQLDYYNSVVRPEAEADEREHLSRITDPNFDDEASFARNMADFDEENMPQGFAFSGSDIAKMGRNRLSEKTYEEDSLAPSLRDVEAPVDRGGHPNRRLQSHLQPGS